MKKAILLIALLGWGSRGFAQYSPSDEAKQAEQLQMQENLFNFKMEQQRGILLIAAGVLFYAADHYLHNERPNYAIRGGALLMAGIGTWKLIQAPKHLENGQR